MLSKWFSACHFNRLFLRDCGFLNSILLPCRCFYFFSPCCLFAGSIQPEGEVGSVPFSSPRKVATNRPKEKTALGWGGGGGPWLGPLRLPAREPLQPTAQLASLCHVTVPSTVGGSHHSKGSLALPASRSLCPLLARSGKSSPLRLSHWAASASLLQAEKTGPGQGGCWAKPLESPAAVGSLGLREGHPSHPVVAVPALQPYQGPEAAFPDRRAGGRPPPSCRSILKPWKLSQRVLAKREGGGESYSCQPLACLAQRPFPWVQMAPYLK